LDEWLGSHQQETANMRNPGFRLKLSIVKGERKEGEKLKIKYLLKLEPATNYMQYSPKASIGQSIVQYCGIFTISSGNYLAGTSVTRHQGREED
jgi:hypothetical protein